jgi:uncharacterized metal-binding protein
VTKEYFDIESETLVKEIASSSIMEDDIYMKSESIAEVIAKSNEMEYHIDLESVTLVEETVSSIVMEDDVLIIQ